jgi:integrase
MVRRSKRPDPTLEEVLELSLGTYYYRDGLVLKVKTPPGGGFETRDWWYRYKSPRTGKPTEHKLGISAYAFTATEARDRIKRFGHDADPVQDKRDAKASIKIFGEVADSWIADQKLTGGLLYTAELYLKQHCAELRDRQISTINADRIMSALRPLIDTHLDTARRVRRMLYTLFEYAIDRNWFAGSNPAKKGSRWPKTQNSRNHPGMPYTEVPAFMAKLRARHEDATAAVALELLILTACRSQEVRLMRWVEIDWDHKVWTLPAPRTKQRARHRVPLTDRMIQILQEQEKLFQGSEYVFYGYSNEALAEKALLRYLRDSMGVKDYVVHGFRNSFSDWAYETAEFEAHLIELSLGHAWGNKTTRSYYRRDALDARRPLMEAWSAYCAGSPGRT